MPANIDSALWLPDESDPRNGFLLVEGWCFLDGQPPHSGKSPSATVDIVVVTKTGRLVFDNLRPMEMRPDVQTVYPGAPALCGFHFVLPIDGPPIGNGIEFTIRNRDAVVGTARIPNVISCLNPAVAAVPLGIRPDMIGKFRNLLLNEYERLSHTLVKRSKPISLYVDPAFNCNLKCPHCHSESLRSKRFNRPILKEDMFDHILEVYGPELIRVTFTLWGEPLLNRRLPDFVRAAKKHRIFAEMSTNLSVPLSDAQLDDIMTAGFDEIRLSIDGITQEVYAKYRVAGSLDLVLRNLRRMVEAKARLGLTTPILKWQFLEWPWNLHEIKEASRLAAEIGVDIFYTLHGDPWQVDLQPRQRSPRDDVMQFDPNLRQRIHERRRELQRNRHAVGCDFLDHTLAINSDGTIHPCCYIVEPKDTVGHVLEGDTDKSSFNAPTLVELRRFVRDFSVGRPVGPSPCVSCPGLMEGHIPDQLNFNDALKVLKQGKAILTQWTSA